MLHVPDRTTQALQGPMLSCLEHVVGSRTVALLKVRARTVLSGTCNRLVGSRTVALLE